MIEVQELWKRYGLPIPRFLRKSAAVVTRRSERTDTLPWALQDISFTIRRGENLGIIGRNGAGKSTLLKLLAGVSPVTCGALHVRGRIFPMIELQAGTGPDLTGRENILLLGAVMGYNPKEIAARYDRIADFAELGDWLDRPVRMYSSGMLARLGMSVALHTHSDILLIDEVLGVGDFKFQQKCIHAIERLVKSEAVTVLFVSHSPYAVQRLCDRVLLLENGKQAFFGETYEGLRKYFNVRRNLGSTVSFSEEEIGSRQGAGAFRVTSIGFVDPESGESVSVFKTAEPAAIRLSYRVSSQRNILSLRLRIFDTQNTCVTSMVHRFDRLERGAGIIHCDIRSLNLMPGTYSLDLKASDNSLQDSTMNTVSFGVEWPARGSDLPSQQGLFFTDASWSIAR